MGTEGLIRYNRVKSQRYRIHTVSTYLGLSRDFSERGYYFVNQEVRVVDLEYLLHLLGILTLRIL